MPFRDQSLDQLDDLRHVLGRARIVRRTLDVQQVGVGEKRLHVPLRNVAERDALTVRPVDDPVVDVGEVGDVGDREPLRLEVAAHDVPRDRVSHVTDMGFVLHRHSADVHARALGMDRLEGKLLPPARVVDAQAHVVPADPAEGRTEIPS